MGWVGWSYEQTMQTPMQEIERAYRAAHARLCAMAGRDIPGAQIKNSSASRKIAPMTLEMFDAWNRMV